MRDPDDDAYDQARDRAFEPPSCRGCGAALKPDQPCPHCTRVPARTDEDPEGHVGTAG